MAGVTVEIGQRLKELPSPPPPSGDVSFRLDVGPGRTRTPRREKKSPPSEWLHCHSVPTTWIWTEGSAEGIKRKGVGTLIIEFPDGETDGLREAARQP